MEVKWNDPYLDILGAVGIGGDVEFYHPWQSVHQMENQVIQYDLKNLQALMNAQEVERINGGLKVTKVSPEAIAQRIREHYLVAGRLIKRCFGKKVEDDFQLYNWGFTLTMDVGLNADKLELLLLIYSRKMPRRCTFSDFEIIIRCHSNYRFLNSHQKKSKWLDLIASFKIHSVRKEGYPDSINKKAFLLIVNVNEIDLYIDMIKITKDMTKNDRYSNRLHMLLLDDPLITGKFSEKTRLKSEYELDEHEREKKKQFQKVLTREEKEFGVIAQNEADEKMKLEFEKAAKLEAERSARRQEKERQRLAHLKAEADEKALALARLEEIKQDRIRHEQLKVEKEKERIKIAVEAARLIKAEEAKNSLIAVSAPATMNNPVDEHKETSVPEENENDNRTPNFDHLTGDERIKAETDYKVKQLRLQREKEREKQKADERTKMESKIATLQPDKLRKLAWMSPGATVIVPSNASPAPLSPRGSKRIGLEQAIQVSKNLNKTKLDSVTPDRVSHEVSRGASPPQLRPISKQDSISAARKKAAQIKENEEEKQKQLLDIEEHKRIEANRLRRLKEDEKRLAEIDKFHKKREMALLDLMNKKHQEEEERRLVKLEEQNRAKEEREKRLRETEYLRNLEKEINDKVNIDNNALPTPSVIKGELEKSKDLRKNAEEREARALAARLKKEEDEKSARAIAVEKSLILKDAIAKAKREKEKKGTKVRNVKKNKSDDKKSMTELSEPAETKSSMTAAESTESLVSLDSTESVVPVIVEETVIETSDTRYEDHAYSDNDSEVVEDQLVDTDQYMFFENESQNINSEVIDITDPNAKVSDEVMDTSMYNIDGALVDVTDYSVKLSDQVVGVPAFYDDSVAIRHYDDDEAQPVTIEVADISMIGQSFDKSVHYEPSKNIESSEDAPQPRSDDSLQEHVLSSEAVVSDSADQNVTAEQRENVEEVEFAYESTQDEMFPEAEDTTSTEEKARLQEELRVEELNKQELLKKIEEQRKEKLMAEKKVKDEAERAERERLRRVADDAAAERAKIFADKVAREREEKAKKMAEAMEETNRIKREAEEERARLKKFEEDSLMEEKLSEERARLKVIEEEERAKEEIDTKRKQLEEDALTDRYVDEPLDLEIDEPVSITPVTIRENDSFVDKYLHLGSRLGDDAHETVDTLERNELERLLLATPPLVIVPFVRRPSTSPPLEILFHASGEDFNFDVPKTDGELRLHIRHDDEGDMHGLFIHGFKPNSKAEQQGLLQIGDELLAIEGIDVKGKYLSDVVDILKGHIGESINIKVLRRHSSYQSPRYEAVHVNSARDSDMSPRPTASDVWSLLHTIPAFEIKDNIVKKPDSSPDLQELFELPGFIYDVIVPKTDGELRIFIRHDDEGDMHGLFIHGFKPNSKAEQQGILHIGDEVLAINNFDVKGKYLEDVIAALGGDYTDNDSVHMVLRRYVQGYEYPSPRELFNQEDNEDYDRIESTRDELHHETFVIQDDVKVSVSIPNLQDIFELPAEEFEFDVPKTDGALRIHIRHDDEGDMHGLFIHGFKPNSKAEQQGLLQIGDELLAIEGIDVKGKYLSDVVDILKDHTDDAVLLRIHRRSAISQLWSQVKSARVSTSPRVSSSLWSQVSQLVSKEEQDKALKESLLHIIHETVRRPSAVPSLDTLFEYPAEDFEFDVPKTDGALRIHIRHDDEGDMHGLFIHGFKPNSKAEQQGLLQIGDELLAIEGIDVKGKYLSDVVDVLKDHNDDSVQLRVRRRKLEVTANNNIIGISSDMLERKTEEMKSDSRQGNRTLKLISRKSNKDDGIESPREELPPLGENEFDFEILKTNRELKLHIRQETSVGINGLFIHGFQPNSKAQKQGLVLPGDEIIAINYKLIRGGNLIQVAKILKKHKGNTSIHIRIKR